MTFTSRRLSAAAVAWVTAFSVSVLAGRVSDAQQKPPTSSGPAPSSGPCRTYDTSVTSVTVGGPMKATIEWTGSFDPWSGRFTQNINFSSNQGSRFSYVQVTTFNSTEDFIAEVVRIKPPAPIMTNPSGPALNIVPPLTRSVSTIGNGAIALSKTNSFDSTGRITGYVTRASNVSMPMRYSAWDALGRPTAGTLQSPAGASSQTITYDDKAMTMTERMTTNNLTSTMTYQYDQFGNMRSVVSSMTGGQGSTTTQTSHSSATVCLGDSRPVAPPAPKPSGPNPAGTFTATIGGQAWSAAIGVNATTTGTTIGVGGSDKRYIVSIGLSATPGPGQYSAGALKDADFSKLTSETFKELIARNSVVVTVFDTTTKQSWQAGPTIGSGTVNLTSVTGAAAGTFSLTLEPVPGTGASGSLPFSGAFNIRF